MKTIRNQTPMIVLIMMTLAAFSSFPEVSHAADESSHWTLKTALVLVDADKPFLIDTPSGGRVQAGGNAELGAMISLEYRWSNLIGLELGIAYAKSPNIDDKTNGDSEFLGEGPGFLPIFAGANLHLVDSDNLSVYVGPRVAYVNFSDFNLDIDGLRTNFDADNEFAWGATAGLAYRFTQSRWSLIAEATYLDVDMTVTQPGTSNRSVGSFDPLIVNLGMSYDF